MCPRCDGLASVIKLKFEYEYIDLLEQLRGMLARNHLKLVDATCDLDKVKPSGVWVNDFIEHILECVACGQHFRLGFETYHLSGGTWEPTEQTTNGEPLRSGDPMGAGLHLLDGLLLQRSGVGSMIKALE
jgi:hypothetical protein